MENTPEEKPHVLIVGAGFGGLEAAKKLACEDVDVLVIDRHNYHLFQPLLYQVATAALSPADIAAPIRHILRRQKNTTLLLDVEKAEMTEDEAARQRLLTFVLVGAGPTGVEMAGALAELARAALAEDF